MILFDVSDKRQEQQQSIVGSEKFDFVNAASLKFFKEYLKDIEHNRHYHFWTGGQWNMHDLLGYLIGITGKADIYFTTWAISEDAVRYLIFLKENKLVSSIKTVFDYKCKEQKSQAFLLAKNNFETALARIHAKVLVIENKDWAITVMGSANWTRNPRAERQMLCTCRDVALNDMKIINQLLAGEHPFKVR